MQPFSFRLQAKLDICCHEEKASREELQICIHQRNQVQKQLESIAGRIDKAQGSLRRLSSGTLLMEQFKIYQDYLPILQRSLEQTADDLNQAEEQVEISRNVLLAKVKETRTLEKLKEKKWETYMGELKLEEQKLIDEAALTGHYRKSQAQNR